MKIIYIDLILHVYKNKNYGLFSHEIIVFFDCKKSHTFYCNIFIVIYFFKKTSNVKNENIKALNKPKLIDKIENSLL